MKTAVLRCAIYTRKSTEEGLDQAFNSLQAQREACEAYVLSQAGEGWTTIPTAYDDGGISGGTMERPALKQLLADIDRGLIDVVVVYKVDRLTRSLMDFARIVERFDKRSVSFVSVTQAFNTTNSMGRLTLNVLLSFAQFEREVTSERIRDKIAASKAKGMWMGGNLPIGYDAPSDQTTRALVLNVEEAQDVRHIFQRYLSLGSVHALKEELDAEGWLTRVKATRSGEPRGGVPYGRGPLFHLLRNRVYRGEITHKGKSYPAKHPPIIDPDTFEAVQRLLDENAAARRRRPTRPEGSPLSGLLFDADGMAMTPALAYGKSGRKYRYYVSTLLQQGRADSLDRDVVRRVAAGALEAMVSSRLRACGLMPMASTWADMRRALTRVQLLPARTVLTLVWGEHTEASIAAARSLLDKGEALCARPGKTPALEMTIPGRPVFRGGRTWIATQDGAAIGTVAKPDPHLLRALQRAHEVSAKHRIGPGASIDDVRTSHGVADCYSRALAPLAFIAPEIQRAIIEGRQPAGLTREWLIKNPLPLAWADQREALGFPAA